MLVASLLDVVRDQQHAGATSPNPLRNEPHSAPLKFEEPLYHASCLSTKRNVGTS